MDYPHGPHRVFVSDFVGFSICVDASQLQRWYIERFMKFRRRVFVDPNSCFHKYHHLAEQEAVDTASQIWHEINGLNLLENILPARERASLIPVEESDHAVKTVHLRK